MQHETPTRPDRSKLDSLLHKCTQRLASDLHLSTNCPPAYRINGALRADDQAEPLTDSDISELVKALLTDEQQKLLALNKSLDTGYTAPSSVRFRINFYYERGGLAMAARWLEGKFLTFEQLRLPAQLAQVSDMRDGLVLVTGATGSGKSTTLATIINQINEQRPCHILTIEDPIEFIHFDKKSVIHQREVGRDVPSFSSAIRAAMREDPDVILLGEMRDTDTMKAALMAAETGHLVFSTLHTNDAVGVIDRVIGAFPGEEQDGVRQQLSTVLRTVITQTLVKVDNGKGRIPVNEILFVDNAVSHLIRKHRPEQIRSVLETARAVGNQSFELALAKRIQERLITKEQAYRLTSREQAVAEFLKVLQDDAVNKRQNTGGALNDS